MNTENAKGMKDISVADGGFTPYTFDEMEGMLESGNVRLENPTSLLASLQTEYSDELTEVITEYVNEMAIPVLLIENRNSILERLKNAFKTVRLLEESIKMNHGVQSDADIRNLQYANDYRIKSVAKSNGPASPLFA